MAAGCSKLICERLSPICGARAKCVRGARACGLQLSAQAKTAASTAALIAAAEVLSGKLNGGRSSAGRELPGGGAAS